MVLIVALLLLVSLAYPQTLRNAKLGGQTVVRRAQASGGETNFVNDSFTESSDVALQSHTGELGATWTQHPSYSASGVSITASIDRAHISADPGAYYASGVPPSADYCVEGVMVVASVVSANSSIVARFDTAANTGYIFQINNGTGWRVRKIVTGTQTTIGVEDTTTNIPSAGQSRTMKMCVSGTSITAYVDGTLLGTVGGTDSSITAAGRAGMRFVGSGNSSAGYHFDSFRAFTP